MLLTRSDAFDGGVPQPPMTRVDDDGAAPLCTLTTKQRQILTAIDRYTRATDEPCPGNYLARRFDLHHSTVQKHLEVLHRKGWLCGPNAPAVLLRRVE